MAATFSSTYKQFLAELTLTFPEFGAPLLLAETATAAEFGALWKRHTAAIAARDAAVFTAAGIPLVPGVTMTAALWSEVSAATQSAIWTYLSSLLLLYTTEEKDEAGLWDLSGFHGDLEAMRKTLKERTDLSGASTEGVASLFEKLVDMAKGAAAGAPAAAPVPTAPFKLPERLFKGHIAKIAEELVREFKPEEFGIDAALLESKDPAHVFTYLQEVFTKRPEMMMNAAQKIGKRLQAKFAKGEIHRDELIREAEELMKEFSDNEAFSSLFGSLGEMFKSGEKESGNEGSARRREVQERLRKKAAAKKEAAATTPSSFAMPTSNVVVDVAAATVAANAAATSLLEEEERDVILHKGAKRSAKK